jgi:ribonucleotide reductase beta subunit family protein with ferritin-like domain
VCVAGTDVLRTNSYIVKNARIIRKNGNKNKNHAMFGRPVLHIKLRTQVQKNIKSVLHKMINAMLGFVHTESMQYLSKFIVPLFIKITKRIRNTVEIIKYK